MRRVAAGPRTAFAIAAAAPLAALSVAAALAPAIAVGQASQRDAPPAAPGAPRLATLAGAGAWHDVIGAHRAPQRPAPGDTESAIVLLRGEPAAAAPAAERAEAARALTAAQEPVEAALRGLGATVTFRFRVLVNGVAVRAPAGGLEAVAALPEVRAVVPVTFLAPAQAGPATSGRSPGPAPTRGADDAPAEATAEAPPAAARRAAHIALVDGAIDPAHPWLGGGIGPTFPIIGGADLVEGDGDPRAGVAPDADGHGTQMASVVLRSSALAGIPPQRFPRLLAYRVIADEAIEGRLRPLARSDRVLAALERAVDPNGDGATGDRAEVILLGLAQGFAGSHGDPVAQALRAAGDLGSSVVAPAGNDGPTLTAPGAVGGPAALPSVITVGATGAERAPRTATLHVALGPAEADLEPLPLLGPQPPAQLTRVALVRSADGLGAGDDPAEYRSPDGASQVDGALAVVGRGGGSIAQKAAAAADAGAVALAVWDLDGAGAFPGIEATGLLPIPVVGLGLRQGEAVAELVRTAPGVQAELRAHPATPRSPGLASFSAWGPTPTGLRKPDLVAPGVDRPAALPGPAPGSPRTAAVSGTSAAAAEVAARTLRLRVERPELGPRAVHSVLVQSARALPGVSPLRQGAGALPDDLATPALAIVPAMVSADPTPAGARIDLRLVDLADADGRYQVVHVAQDGERTPVGQPVAVAAGGAARVAADLPLPAGTAQPGGRIEVARVAAAATVASAPFAVRRPATTPQEALGRPQIDATEGRAQARVRLGRLEHADGRLHGTRLHGLRLALVPRDGGDPLLVAGSRQPAEWPAGSYRFALSRRLSDGTQAPAGPYRLRVTATGPDGTVLRRESAPLRLS